MQIINLK